MKIVITVEVPDGADVSVGTSESVAASKAKAKKVAAAESAAQAAPVVAAAASAPAPAEPVTAPATPTLSLTKDVNPVVSKLAGKDRDAALKILLAHGASANKTSTSQLKPEVYQAVIDETEEAIAKFDAASVQTANSGSLV